MLYRLCRQYDHVIMLSKNQSAHSPGRHLINLGADSFKGIKPSGQRWLCWHNPLIFFYDFSTPPSYFRLLWNALLLWNTLWNHWDTCEWDFLTDRIIKKLGKSHLINEHALNDEPVPLNLFLLYTWEFGAMFSFSSSSTVSFSSSFGLRKLKNLRSMFSRMKVSRTW